MTYIFFVIQGVGGKFGNAIRGEGAAIRGGGGVYKNRRKALRGEAY
jgi:hypothetical protein